MPFTFSHPAIVLPITRLAKDRLSLTGLIIGSVVPDFEYFIRMSVKSIYSHTWLGLFWCDLPLALVLMVIYENLVKDELVDHLPTPLTLRFVNLKGLTRYSGSKIFYVIISILIGALSHLLWDGFTHPTGLFVTLIPILSSEIYLAGHTIFGYQILQHASTIVGALAICVTIYKLPCAVYKKGRPVTGFWLWVIGVATITLAFRSIAGLSATRYGDIIVSAITGMLLGLLVASIVARLGYANHR